MKRGDQIIIQHKHPIKIEKPLQCLHPGEGGGTEGYFGYRCAPLDLQTLPLFKTKIVHNFSLLCLRQETLFYDPDSF